MSHQHCFKAGTEGGDQCLTIYTGLFEVPAGDWLDWRNSSNQAIEIDVRTEASFSESFHCLSFLFFQRLHINISSSPKTVEGKEIAWSNIHSLNIRVGNLHLKREWICCLDWLGSMALTNKWPIVSKGCEQRRHLRSTVYPLVKSLALVGSKSRQALQAQIETFPGTLVVHKAFHNGLKRWPAP